MEELTDAELRQLKYDIATRAGDIEELCLWYGIEEENDLLEFVDENRTELEAIRLYAEQNPQPTEEESTAVTLPLEQLWIAQKIERLNRYQRVADHLYESCVAGVDAAALREYRAYLRAVAEELGQLLHRGAGDAMGDEVLNVKIDGVDMDRLR